MKKQTKQKIERESVLGSGRGIFFAVLLCMTLLPMVCGGSVSYDLVRDNVSMEHDDGGRIVSKGDYVYGYFE